MNMVSKLSLLWLAAFLLTLIPEPFGGIDKQSAWADDDDDDDDDDAGDDDDDETQAPPRQRSRARAELIVSGLSQQALGELSRRGYRITSSANSTSLGATVSRILGPRGVGAAAALRQIQRLSPNALAARNDVFRRSPIANYSPRGSLCGTSCEAFDLTGWQSAYLTCTVAHVIGVIDTRVERGHPSLAGADLELATVRRKDRGASGADHGTGVVSVFVGQPETSVVGVLPKAKIIAVDAFHRSQGGDAADAFDLVAALDVLAERNVKIVNMSLSGPSNAVLAKAIARLADDGTTIVAAAGPQSGAGTGFPARYRGAIAVAAVDARLRPSRLSARGAHISFAGPGVGVPVATADGKSKLATGTSFATPFVSAAFASAKMNSAERGGDTSAKLQSLAKDLGAPGRDAIFGWGLVQFPPAKGC